MRRHERIVVQMRVGAIDAVNFLGLARAERLVRVKTPDPFEQSLPAQHFVQPGDAAAETVRRVEERRVAVRHLHAALQPFRAGRRAPTFREQLHRAFGPHRPVTEQASDDPQRFAAEAERRQQIGNNVVVVAGVERDVVAPESATARTTSKVW